MISPKPQATIETTDANAAEPDVPGLFAAGAAVGVRTRSDLLATLRTTLASLPEVGAVAAELQPLEEWRLVHQGKLAESDLLRAYAHASGLPILDESEVDAVTRLNELEATYLQHWLCLPVDWRDTRIVMALALPWQLGDIAMHCRQMLGLEPRFYLLRRSLLERRIGEIYEHHPTPEDARAARDDSEEALRDLASEAPIVRLVNDMFTRAIELGASDIHVEPGESQLGIRYRIDGILRTVMTPPLESYAAIASRLKLIGALNIAERRLPQDGRTDLAIGRTRIDVRISCIPTLHGESIVLRLLQKDVSRFNFDTLGMDGDIRRAFGALIRAPHGMVLVVGPTGSGKTTTLYCAIGLLNRDERKIITIEDPIEYQIAGASQMQVKPAIGLTFAGGLRHIVRQDPDVILVGEIRDRETAEIAIHAALTGHLVLSTLHTNDAVGAISRLLDMGIEDYLLSSSLIGVLSQRLVRRRCRNCDGSGTHDGRTCRICLGAGFSGRIGIFEYLAVSEAIRAAIRAGADTDQLNGVARTQGMRPLAADGERLVAAGLTSADEVARVCSLGLS